VNQRAPQRVKERRCSVVLPLIDKSYLRLTHHRFELLHLLQDVLSAQPCLKLLLLFLEIMLRGSCKVRLLDCKDIAFEAGVLLGEKVSWYLILIIFLVLQVATIRIIS